MIIDWAKGAYTWLRKRKPASTSPGNAILSELARLAGSLFGVLLFIGVAGLQISLTTIDPSLGVPAYTFGEPPMFIILPVLAYLMAGLGTLMLVFTLLAWVRQLWSMGSRIYYSLLTLSALSILWVFWFWNLNILLT
jgi:hypothetical protein